MMYRRGVGDVLLDAAAAPVPDIVAQSASFAWMGAAVAAFVFLVIPAIFNRARRSTGRRRRGKR